MKTKLRFGTAPARSADFQSAVSRISNPQTTHKHERHGDLNARPAGSRRYSRLETCATVWRSVLLGWVLLLFTLNLQPSTLLAQGTAFTYQGRLDAAGAPANGSFDLRFAIYDAASGGSLLAGPLTNTAVAVSNGLFTVALDFGAGVFDGPARWLEIGVRTNGGGAFTALSPRQALTATPYAILAGGISGSITPSQISGALMLDQLPSAVLTNDSGSVSLGGNFNGTFTGNGSSLTLSSNVALRAGGNTFSGDQTLLGGRLAVGRAPLSGPFEVWVETESVDQQQTSAGSAGLRTDPWQSFTPALSGALTAIEVRDGVSASAWTSTLIIYSGEGTNGTVLSSQTVSRSPGIIGRVTLAQPVPLNAGTLYTFQVLGTVRMDYEFSSTYSRGRNEIWPTADYYFRTFMTNAVAGLTVSGAGYVGIGTTNLDRPLTLQPLPGSSEWISFKNAQGSTLWHLNNNLNGWNLAQSGVADYRLFLATNGNIGIGLADPVRALEVAARTIADGIQVRGNGNAAGFYLSQNGTENGVLGLAAAAGQYSTAAAANDVVLRSQQRLFVQSGGGDPAITITTANRVGIGNTAPGDPLVVVNARCDGSSWINASDRALKENFAPVKAREVLEKVVALPLNTWNYRSQAPVVRHIGPTAQDFRAAFGLGESDTGIATVDADGVALAAIQGLNQKVEAKTRELGARSEELEARSRKLEAENAELKAELKQIKQLLDSLASQLNGGAQ